MWCRQASCCDLVYGLRCQDSQQRARKKAEKEEVPAGKCKYYKYLKDLFCIHAVKKKTLCLASEDPIR